MMNECLYVCFVYDKERDIYQDIGWLPTTIKRGEISGVFVYGISLSTLGVSDNVA
jgi:hypothetical protein